MALDPHTRELGARRPEEEQHEVARVGVAGDRTVLEHARIDQGDVAIALPDEGAVA